MGQVLNSASRLTVLIVTGLAAGLLLWAMRSTNPYGYYLLLRWVICPICLYLALATLRKRLTGWAWLLGVLAVMYNPVLRVHLTRGVWALVNGITAILLLVAGYLVSKRSPAENG